MTRTFSVAKGKEIRADEYKWHVKTAKLKLLYYMNVNISMVRKRYKFLLLLTIIIYSPTS